MAVIVMYEHVVRKDGRKAMAVVRRHGAEAQPVRVLPKLHLPLPSPCSNLQVLIIIPSVNSSRKARLLSLEASLQV